MTAPSPTPAPRVTLGDVATAAGVSVSTVQRVLRDDARVAPSTAARVGEAVRRTGLQPDRIKPGRPRGPAATAVAPRRAAKETHAGLHLALLLSPALKPEAMHFFPPVVEALTEQAAAHGTLSLVQVPVGDAPLIPRLAAMGVDGVLAILSKDPAEVEALSKVEEHFPLVWVLGADVAARVGTHVTADNVGVGSLAATHLHGRGCDAAWFFTDTPDRELFYRRWVGFQLQAMRSGLPATPVLIGGDKQAERLAGELYGSHLLRFETADAALAHAEAARGAAGVFVPADLMLSRFFPAMQASLRAEGNATSLVSCDGIERYLAAMDPRPASIELGVREMARIAVQEINLKLQDPGRPHRQVLVSPRLTPAP